MHFWGPAGNAKYSYEQLRTLQGCEVGWGQGGKRRSAHWSRMVRPRGSLSIPRPAEGRGRSDNPSQGGWSFSLMCWCLGQQQARKPSQCWAQSGMEDRGKLTRTDKCSARIFQFINSDKYHCNWYRILKVLKSNDKVSLWVLWQKQNYIPQGEKINPRPMKSTLRV